MEDWQRKKIQEAINDIDTSLTELKIQVLNNIDAQMVEKATAEDKLAIQTFVKQPIMRVVNRLNGRKLVLMKLIQTIVKS